MSKKIKQALAGILLTCIMWAIMPAGLLVSMAASGKITFSDPSGEVGQEVTVNMKISTEDGSLGSADMILAYDSSALRFIDGNSVEGGAGTLRARGGPDPADLSNIVFSMRFQLIKEGASQITISSQEVYDNNSQPLTISHQGSSTITAASTGAETAEGLLTMLAVAPGTLTPEFSPLIDTYSVHVGMNVEQIQVQALAGEGSHVAIEGSEGLQMGENTVSIRVTAPDGITVKNYSISVTKSEGGETEGTLNTEITEGVSLEAAEKAITILPPEEGVELPEVFSRITINIDGHQVAGWVWGSETEHQYCIFYAMDITGEKGFYRYDLTEKTIQRYFLDPAAQSGYTKEQTEEIIGQYNSLLDDYQFRMYIIIALAAVATVLLILVIVLLATRSSGKDSKQSNLPKEKEPAFENRREVRKERVVPEDREARDETEGKIQAFEEEELAEEERDDEDFDIIDTLGRPEQAAAQMDIEPVENLDILISEEEQLESSDEADEDFELLDVD